MLGNITQFIPSSRDLLNDYGGIHDIHTLGMLLLSLILLLRDNVFVPSEVSMRMESHSSKEIPDIVYRFRTVTLGLLWLAEFHDGSGYRFPRETTFPVVVGSVI